MGRKNRGTTQISDSYTVGHSSTVNGVIRQNLLFNDRSALPLGSELRSGSVRLYFQPMIQALCGFHKSYSLRQRVIKCYDNTKRRILQEFIEKYLNI